ncbi:MAG: TAXI family TRAP transporter solute-binding subunit [Acidobacteriota bacterium]
MHLSSPTSSLSALSRRALTMLALAALVLASLMVACGGGSAPDGEEAASSSPRFLSIGTAPPGGAFFVVGGALAEVLGSHFGDGSTQVTAEATQGSQENIRRLAQGDLDLALSNSAITYFGVRGEGDWDQAYPARAVLTLAPNVALFVTPSGSGIESIADLAGRRVVIGPAGAGFHYFVRPILAAHGIAWEDLTVLHNTQSGAVDMLADGSADAAFLGGAVPTASITQAASGQSIVFLPFDPEARQRLIDEYLFFRPATIPAGTYRGQEEDYLGLDVGSMHFIASADADDEVIYEVTRALYENREEVATKHPAGRAINPNNAARSTGTPFHPAAERYFREAGIWPEAASVDAEGSAADGEVADPSETGESTDSSATDDEGSDAS